MRLHLTPFFKVSSIEQSLLNILCLPSSFEGFLWKNLQRFPSKEDLCASASLFLTPIEILKGTLHSIKCEAQ